VSRSLSAEQAGRAAFRPPGPATADAAAKSTEPASRDTVASALSARRHAQVLTLALALGALALAACSGLVLGAVRIPPGEVIAYFAHPLGLGGSPESSTVAVLGDIRLPRLALSLVGGAALALAGAAMQGTFRNPLADPGVVGVSAGCAAGAAVATVAGVSLGALPGLGAVAASAFVGGLLASLFAYRFARYEGRTEVLTLILAGIAVNAIGLGVLGWMLYIADDAELRSLTGWLLGSFAGAHWRDVALVAALLAVGIVVLQPLARSLDALALGEREASDLGVPVERVRALAIAAASLLTAGTVAVAGSISFVGLVAPHIVRLAAGPGHRFLLPTSAVAGAALCGLADLAARTVALPQEVPIGVVTALVGGPFFLWLVRRARVRAVVVR